VADANGHEVEAPQDVIELTSGSVRDALDAATQRFAEVHHIPDWSLHADGIAIAVRA